MTAQTGHESPHPRRDAFPAAACGTLLQAHSDRAQLMHHLRDRDEASGVARIELSEQVPENVGLGARRVQVRDQHPSLDQLCQQAARLLHSGLGKLRPELVREGATADRRPGCGQDHAHWFGQGQGRLDRASPVALDIGLERHDEPVSPACRGAVGDNGQPFEKVRARLQPFDHGGQPLCPRAAQGHVLIAPGRTCLRPELRGGHTGEQAEGRRSMLGPQQISDYGQRRASHVP